MLVIPREDCYPCNNTWYFKLQADRIQYRDILVCLSKNTRQSLLTIATVLKIPNRHHMQKAQLLEILESQVIFDDPAIATFSRCQT